MGSGSGGRAGKACGAAEASQRGPPCELVSKPGVHPDEPPYVTSAPTGHQPRRDVRHVPRSLLTLKARVLIRPKQGILDPQGQAVERALPALGFEGVESVHVGRLVELEVADPSRLEEMCEQLLANPLIEDYEVQLGEAAAR